MREVQVHPTQVINVWRTCEWSSGSIQQDIVNLLKKVGSKSKRDWHETLREVLSSCRTSYMMPPQSTPYALVYGIEVVLPSEIQIAWLQIAIEEGFYGDENNQLRLVELEALNEKRLQAKQRSECYQASLTQAFNKKVQPCLFQVGYQVLELRRSTSTIHKTEGKFTSTWEGPYVVYEVYTNGAYKVVDGKGF